MNPFNPTFGDVPFSIPAASYRTWLSSAKRSWIRQIHAARFDQYVSEVQNPDSAYYLGY